MKAFARWFQKPEGERSQRAPRDHEVIEALSSILCSKKYAGNKGRLLGVPEFASERIGYVVEIIRETQGDPMARIDRIDQRLDTTQEARYAGR